MFECHICGNRSMIKTGKRHVSISGIVRYAVKCVSHWCKWEGTLEQKTIEQEN